MKRLNKSIAFVSLLFFGTPAFSAPHAYPVPFSPGTNAAHTKITFTELPDSGTIKIYNMQGRLVVELPIPNTNLLDWPVTNTKGEKLATGVYIYLITGGGAQYDGKLVVVR